MKNSGSIENSAMKFENIGILTENLNYQITRMSEKMKNVIDTKIMRVVDVTIHEKCFPKLQASADTLKEGLNTNVDHRSGRLKSYHEEFLNCDKRRNRPTTDSNYANSVRYQRKSYLESQQS